MNIVNCDASLEDVLVSFNGERKFPLSGGTVNFYNVASNVPQPYTVSKGGVVLASDTLNVDDDLELLIDLQAVDSLAATGTSPTTIELSYAGGAAGATYVLERSDGGRRLRRDRPHHGTQLYGRDRHLRHRIHLPRGRGTRRGRTFLLLGRGHGHGPLPDRGLPQRRRGQPRQQQDRSPASSPEHLNHARPAAGRHRALLVHGGGTVAAEFLRRLRRPGVLPRFAAPLPGWPPPAAAPPTTWR